jgi:hypothetical protein
MAKSTKTTTKNTQGAPSSQHDIGHDASGPTSIPDAGKIEQGTKPSEVRSPADKK